MSEEQTTGIVIYTDGGCRYGNGSVGYAGSGLHGYVYSKIDTKKGSGIPDNIATDTGYVRKDNPDFAEAQKREVTPLQYFDGIQSFGELISNNVAELTACITAIELAIGYKDHPIKKIQIRTDSEYTCKGLEQWLDGWKANNWLKADGNPPANIQFWRRLDELKSQAANMGVELNIQWVKAHNGDLGNEKADNLATLGVMASYQKRVINEITYLPIEGYWKYSSNKHPLVAYRRLYFNTQENFNKPGIYYLGEHGKDDDLIGKRMTDGAYSVVMLTEPDEVIEMVRDYQITLASDLDTIVMIRLDKLYRPDTHHDLKKYGTLAINRPSALRMDLHCLDKEPLTRELQPPRLAMRAVDAISDLLGRLDAFYTQDQTDLTVTDITDSIFKIEDVVKKKEVTKVVKLKDEFGVGFTSFKVEGNYKTDSGDVKQYPITLTLGLDLVDRNTLKRIEDLNPKVYLITWPESDKAFRYATVIETDTGKGIFCGYYSNLIFISK